MPAASRLAFHRSSRLAAAHLQGSYSNLHMNGQEVFKFAVRAVPTVSVRRGSAWCMFRGDACRAVGRQDGGAGGWQGRYRKPRCPDARRLRSSTRQPPITPRRRARLCLLQVIEAALADAGMEKQQIDWLVMHQANMRIMSAAADRLGVPAGEKGSWGWVRHPRMLAPHSCLSPCPASCLSCR